MHVPSDTPLPDISAAGHDQETARISKIAFYAFLLNLGLAAMKGALAVFSDSLAVTAGAIDSGTDAVASLLLFGGLKLSTRKSPSFPLGLFKIENFISIVVALLIFFAGYEIASEVVTPIAGKPSISMAVVLLLLAGVLATHLFGRYAASVGRRTGSPTLIAEGRHRQVDVHSSLVVLFSAVLGYVGWEFTIFGIHMDQIAAGLVLVCIARAGWGLLTDGMRVLLDASIDHETLDRIRRIIEEHPMVIQNQSLIGHSAGRFRFLQASVMVRTGDLRQAHSISEALESRIRDEIPNVRRVMIHYEPQPRSHIRIAVPVSDPSGTISDDFGESPCFAVVELRLSDGHIENHQVIENPHIKMGSSDGIRVAEWLVRQKIDRVFVKKDLTGEGPGYVLGNAGVAMVTTMASQVKEVIESEVNPEV
jgi:cation diffusion facilitator family transporter